MRVLRRLTRRNWVPFLLAPLFLAASHVPLIGKAPAPRPSGQALGTPRITRPTTTALPGAAIPVPGVAPVAPPAPDPTPQPLPTVPAASRLVVRDQSFVVPRNSVGSVKVVVDGADNPGNLRYSIVDKPQFGDIAGSGPAYGYLPRAGYTGADKFTWQVTDSRTGEIAGPVTARIWVSDGINRAPVARDQSAVIPTASNSSLRLDFDDVDSNGPFTVRITSAPTLGSLLPTGDAATWNYLPNPRANGEDRFTWTVSDGSTTSSVATFSLRLDPAATPQAPAPGASAAATTAGASRNSGGLLGSYFASRNPGGPPALERIEAIDFSWVEGSPAPGLPADNFSARWTGDLRPPTSGEYTIVAEADDGIRVDIDGRRIIDGWTSNAPGTLQSPPLLLLADRFYPISVEFSEQSGSARVRLMWRLPGSSRNETIPPSALFPPPEARPSLPSSATPFTDAAALAPVITAQSPGIVDVPLGSPAVLQVVASGPGPLSYQWYWNGNPIQIGKSADFPIARMEPRFAGVFSCEVSNAHGKTTSSPIVLRVAP